MLCQCSGLIELTYGVLSSAQNLTLILINLSFTKLSQQSNDRIEKKESDFFPTVQGFGYNRAPRTGKLSAIHNM